MDRREKVKILDAINRAREQRRAEIQATHEQLLEDRLFANDTGINRKEYIERRMAAETRNMIRKDFVATSQNVGDSGVNTREKITRKSTITRMIRAFRKSEEAAEIDGGIQM